MESNRKNSVFVDGERLRNFLENNQLIQAHAIAQKLEVILQETLAKEADTSKIETHPLWPAFKACVRIKSRVLSGKTQEALSEAILLQKTVVGS